MRLWFSAVLVFLVCVGDCSTAQNAPLVIAFAAPNIPTPCPSGSNSYFCNFINYELQYVSGIGVRVPWGKVDDCSSNSTLPRFACERKLYR